MTLALAVLGIVAAAPSQQNTGAGKITIDRLFDGGFGEAGFGPAWWLEDSGFATLESAADGKGRDLVRYDTVYQERYMGLPKDNAEGFRDGSPITHAHRLRGKLLLVYGTGDDNCHYQNCEALVDELIRHDKQFDMQIYPNRTHSIRLGRNTRRHLYTRLTRYLTEHLPAGAR